MVQEKLTGVKYAHEKSFTKYRTDRNSSPISTVFVKIMWWKI